MLIPVFRTFLGHPCNILIVSISFVFLGVPKLKLCLFVKRETPLEALVFK